VTTNSTSDPTSGTGGEPAKPTRARKPPVAKTGAAKTGDKPAKPKTAVKPKGDSKPAPKSTSGEPKPAG